MRQDSHLHVSICPIAAALILCPAWLPATDHETAASLFAGAHPVTEHGHLLQILDADAVERGVHALVLQSPSHGVLIEIPYEEAVQLLVARQLHSTAWGLGVCPRMPFTAAKHAQSMMS